MDVNNPIIRLCLAGNRAELEGRIADARDLFWQAWERADGDYEACIAAHYVARHQESARDALGWNQEALTRAERVDDPRVQGFYPSLYVNLGYSHEAVGNQAEAQRYYKRPPSLVLSIKRVERHDGETERICPAHHRLARVGGAARFWHQDDQSQG
ncbi:MAG: hypothetical protein HC802_03420 [Caldilineaceae bacterium]|nr:hypothetical protein [Caldilineaceae bacterium]